MRLHFRRAQGPLLLALAAAFVASPTEAAIRILTPPDGETRVADDCPFPICSATFASQVEVTGDPVEFVDFDLTPDTGIGFSLPICQPPDPIEGTPGCAIPPAILNSGFILREGGWTVVARARRGTQVEISTPIHVIVLPPTLIPAGTISLSRVSPLVGTPAFFARDPSPSHPSGIVTTPTEVTIFGQNLHNNPFLDVYLSPIRSFEPPLAAESGLPVAEWCRHQALIVDRGTTSTGESFLKVQLPPLPLEAPTNCAFPPGPSGSIFQKTWRWLIHDRWIRPERMNDYWAIPTPQQLPWRDAPPFRVGRPAYPLIDGFGFQNKDTSPRYNEFLTVYGNNAYLCVGAFGVCLTRLPDPLYHLFWWPIYDQVISSTGGSCNGMSATSLLMAREELQTEPFSPDVHFPIGFDDAGDPATYADSNFCTPICSPPKPENLWAHIRMNHGVQFSREFLFQVIDTLGESIFDPNDVGSIRGVPQATLERVISNPLGHVLCLFQPGNGHCVTPYRVEGNRMLIYDNNNPNDASRYIEVVGGDYNYPARTEEPNHGDAIMAFPIDLWKNGRHLLGAQELLSLIQGDIVEFLFMIVVGAGDMTVTNEAGGRWGYEEDGTFTDSLLGAVSIPPLGPQPVEARSMPLVVAMNQPPPTAEVNAKGGRYLWNAGAGGHLFQLEAAGAQDGDKDRIRVDHAPRRLASFDFTPQRDSSHVVPRVGLAMGEQETALFHWLGLSVPGGANAGFGADKEDRAVTYRNDTGGPTHHLLALDYAAGQVESSGRMIYGPFPVPDGASHRVRLASWPDVAEVVSELDLDRDGTPDQTDTVPGRPAPSPLGQGQSADLSVTKDVSDTRVAFGQSVTFTVTVSNAGPDSANEVKLFDALPASTTVSDVATTLGDCDADDDGLRCEIGFLAPGDSAVVTYVVRPRRRGTFANGAFAFGREGDPDLTNNTAFAQVDVPVRIDIKPGHHHNVVKPGSRELIPVAILGQRGLDLRDIDASTVVFGPDGARHVHRHCRGFGFPWGRHGEDDDDEASHHGRRRPPSRGHQRCGRIEDVNHDGRLDLVWYFRTDETGIDLGDTRACLRGSFRDGRPFAGCDAILTRRWWHGHGSGSGEEP